MTRGIEPPVPHKHRKKPKRYIWVDFIDKHGEVRSRKEVRKSGTFVRLGPVDKIPKGGKGYGNAKQRKSKAVRKRLRVLRRKGGSNAMAFRFRDYPGIRAIDDSGPPPVLTIQVTTAASDNLFNISSVNGNFKAPNPQAFQHEVTSRNNGVVGTLYPTRSVITTGVMAAAYNPLVYTPGGWNSTAYNQALSRVFDSFRGNIDLSIDLAELHKSNSMIKKAFKGIAHAGLTFRKMRRSNPRDWGNLWLEFTYGWKPLANDIYESFERLLEPNKTWWTAHGRGYDQDHAQKVTNDSDEGTSQTETADLLFRAEIKCRMMFTNSQLTSLAGYTSLNPVSIAWELLPYSFVADWFVNIGGYLRNLESTIIYSQNFRDGYLTESVLDTNKLGKGGGAARRFEPQTRDYWSYTASFKGVKKRRVFLNSLPFPRSPVFKPQLGSSRLISAAALLGQQLNSLKH